MPDPTILLIPASAPDWTPEVLPNLRAGVDAALASLRTEVRPAHRLELLRSIAATERTIRELEDRVVAALPAWLRNTGGRVS